MICDYLSAAYYIFSILQLLFAKKRQIHQTTIHLFDLPHLNYAAQLKGGEYISPPSCHRALRPLGKSKGCPRFLSYISL